MFISKASDEIQDLLGLHTAALNQYHSMLTYFGENPKNPHTGEIFSSFATFVTKFEVICVAFWEENVTLKWKNIKIFCF